MFKGNKKYYFIFFGLFALILLAQYLLPKPVNWNRTYQNKDKAPFGCYAIYNLINGVYSQQTGFNNKTFYNLKDRVKDSCSIIVINNDLNLNKSDLSSLNQILKSGNTVLLAANQFNGLLADTFHLSTSSGFESYFSIIDSLINKPGESIHLVASNQSTNKFSFSRAANIATFRNFDTTRFKVLAFTETNKACLIKTRVGKGTLMLLSVPDIFTNYFVVKHKNRQLAYLIFSLLKNRELIWDEYYKSYNVSNYSFLKFIFESDTLYAAYLLLFFSIVFYMIFEGRRRQAPIPVIEPVTNSTLDFVNVISHVYFNSKNHQTIALERIKYFYESVRKKFNTSTTEINEHFINEISELSGVQYLTVKQLFTYCERLKHATDLTEYELIELNRQITNFNNYSQR
ncbi:MAG: hypothetical protein JWO32_1436 [Bacteroidetes bacterium]|nr:hypothetical protein [Bacteroidota bacterium]